MVGTWYLVVLSQYEAAIDVIGSVGGIDALHIYRESGDMVR